MKCPYCNDTGIHTVLIWELTYKLESKPFHCPKGKKAVCTNNLTVGTK